MSSLSLAVSIPAQSVMTDSIFSDPALLRRTRCSGNHPGPRKGLARSSYLRASNGLGPYDPTPAARFWVATQDQALLSEQTKLTEVGYYKVSSTCQLGPRSVPHAAPALAQLVAEDGKQLRPSVADGLIADLDAVQRHDLAQVAQRNYQVPETLTHDRVLMRRRTWLKTAD